MRLDLIFWTTLALYVACISDTRGRGNQGMTELGPWTRRRFGKPSTATPMKLSLSEIRNLF